MSDPSSTPTNPIDGARDIAAPSHAVVSEIFRYWDSKRGTRRMPSRAAIDPVELRRLVPNTILIDVVEPEERYRVRLVGGAITDFFGRNMAGAWEEQSMAPTLFAQMTAILTSVVVTRAPRFRAGRAQWHVDKSFRGFEACWLPLSPDDNRVNKILGGIAFERTR